MEFLAQLHPKIVHFPIAFFLAYVLFELMGIILKKEFFLKAAHLILFLGVLGAIAAVLTGNSAEQIARQLSKEGAAVPLNAIGNHEDFANFTMWYFTGLLVFRTFLALKKKFIGKIRLLFILLALIGSFLVYQTGELGGKLVYKYGIGTDKISTEIRK